MSSYIVLLLAFFSVQAFPTKISDHDDRIVGGELADIREIPWQVAMIRFNGVNFFMSCGGSILKPSVIITAAHCPAGTMANDWKVRAGSNQSLSGGQVRDVVTYVMHENYGSNPLSRRDWDIALLMLDNPIVINDVTAALVTLPIQNLTIEEGTAGVISGWGTLNEEDYPPPDLRKANISVVNWELCVESYLGTNRSVTERMICLGDYENGGVDACYGDSGSAFTVNGVILGIVSDGDGCGRPRSPGIWTNVPVFRDWIDTNVPPTDYWV